MRIDNEAQAAIGDRTDCSEGFYGRPIDNDNNFDIVMGLTKHAADRAQ
jgi:hypothetical protein